MAMTIGKLFVVYSGGAANTDQQSSLGGAISTAVGNKVVSQEFTPPNLVTGVTIKDAMGNAEGTGVLRWDFAAGALNWKPSGGSTYDGYIISGNGLYTLGTTGGYLLVDVVAGSLPGASTQDNITITNAVNKTFDNISAQESLVGDTEYRCFYVKNTDATSTAYDVRLWIKNQPSGSDTLSIALDPVGTNGTALGPLADENDPTALLAGVTFSAPSTQATGLLVGDLAPGQYRAFWVKRAVPMNTTQQMLHDTSAIGISALI